MRTELSEEDYKPLKCLLGVLRKDWAVLSDENQDRLVALFEHSPALQQACSLRWVLTSLFNAASTRERAEATL